MKNSLLAICFLLSVALHTRAHAADDEIQFQRDSETATEETQEMKDGKMVRKVRSGKVKQRKGGPRVGEIQEDEVNQIERRQKSLHFTAFGFGPFWSSNVGGGKVLYGASLGRHWEVTTKAEIVAEIIGAANGHGSLFAGNLGFNFLPLTEDVSPIVGIEFGGGYGSGHDSSDESVNQGGFTLQGNLGARLFRLSETQMEIMGSYTAVLSNRSPNLVGVQLRILF